jgi:endonuclease-3
MDRTSDARWMVDRLASRYGPVAETERSPVETLVLTILSQNTTDTNRDQAYASLLDRFATLEAVARAPEAEIEEAIRVGGLQKQKAHSIRASLTRILDERGRLELDFLGTLDLSEALVWLLDLPGVGRKTAGIVLLFSFGRPYFPVDTHIRRVLTRVGWLQGREEPHRRVNRLLQDDPRLMSDLHLQLIRLGRTLCKPRAPLCGECPIRDRCRHGRRKRP